MHASRIRVLTMVGCALAAVSCATTGSKSGTTTHASTGPSEWADVIESQPDPRVVTNAEYRSRISATGLPWRVRERLTGVEMLLVPPGEFVMGMSVGDPDAMDDERPAHRVTISQPFYLGRYELTQGEWVGVMGYNPSYFQEANFAIRVAPDAEARMAELVAEGHTKEEAQALVSAGDLVESDANRWPLETVTPADVEPFLRRTGLRLPTEAEWEYACRGGLREPRYGELDEIAWYTGNSEQSTHVVGSKLPNSLGFHDMIGNVWEWCSDWYGSDYYTDCEGGVIDPTGPGAGDFGVARGGSWDHVPANCRSSFRENHFMPDPRITDFGIRVARNP
jgi:formylglycine-generating enzyme required for sulfatase activity